METEVKFIIPGEAAFARLRAATHFGQYRRSGEASQRVRDQYLDTPGARFLKEGWAVRLRHVDHGEILVTLKGLARLDPQQAARGIHARAEHEVKVSNPQVESWPQAEATTIVRAIAQGQPLAELVSVDQVRTVSRLYDGERAVAELSLDQVSYNIEGEGEARRAYELEAELLPDGTLEDLQAIARVLREEYGLDPQPRSKFEQAISFAGGERKLRQASGRGAARSPIAPIAPVEPVDPAEPVAVPQPETEEAPARETKFKVHDSMAYAARRLLAQHFAAMLSNEEGARLGEDPEAVHDMRVATRRMRAAFQVFGPHLQSKAALKVARGLRDVARALGGVRDLDVLIENAERFRESLSPEHAAGIPGLIEEWRVQRWKARKELLRLLDSDDYRRLKSNMRRLLDEKIEPPSQEEEAVPYQVRHLAGSAILRRYEEVRAYEALPDAPTLTQIHSLRIHAKYLRYTLEFFRDVLSKEAVSLIRDVVKLQDVLGELHDADVASQLLREHMGRRYSDGRRPGARRGAGQATEAQEAQATRYEGLETYLREREEAIRSKQVEYLPAWANLYTPEWRKRLSSVMML